MLGTELSVLDYIQLWAVITQSGFCSEEQISTCISIPQYSFKELRVMRRQLLDDAIIGPCASHLAQHPDINESFGLSCHKMQSDLQGM